MTDDRRRFVAAFITECLSIVKDYEVIEILNSPGPRKGKENELQELLRKAYGLKNRKKGDDCYGEGDDPKSGESLLNRINDDVTEVLLELSK